MPGTGLPTGRGGGRVLLQQTPIYGGGGGQNYTWGTLSQLGQQLEQFGEKMAVRQAAQDGEQAVVRDEQGRLRVELRDPWTAADETYNRVALTRYMAKLDTDVRAKQVELSQQYRDDPDGFNAAWKGFTDGTLGAVDRRVGEHAMDALERARVETWGHLTEQKRRQDTALTTQTLKADVEAMRADVLSLAYSGGANTPQFEHHLSRLKEKMEAGVGAKLWDSKYVELFLDKAESEAKAEALVGGVERIYRAKGADAALEHVRAVATDTELTGLKPTEREAFMHRAQSQIRLWESERKGDLAEVKVVAQEMRQKLATGMPVDDREFDGVVATLRRAGGVGEAARLLRAKATFDVLQGIGKLPPDEQEKALEGVESRLRPLADRIIGAEWSPSGPNKNPNSSATGPGQFIDGTWLPLVKRAAPEVAAGKTDAQILALRDDTSPAGRTLARRMVEAHAAENRAALDERGLPSDDGAVYLAHFAGIGGASKVLSAAPATPVEQLLDAGAISANPFLRGKTAGDLRAWAEQKVGGSSIDAETLKELRQMPGRTREALKADPLAHAARIGVVPSLPDIDWSNGDAATAALVQRQKAARVVEQHYTLGAVPVFRRDEIDALKATYDRLDSDGRAGLLGTLAKSLDGDHLTATLEKVAGDRPLFAWAGALYTRNPEVARSVIHGEAVMKSLDKAVVPKDDATTRQTIADKLGTAMQHLPQARAAATQAAMARYADLSAKAGDFSGALDTSRMEQAISDVTGGIVLWGGSWLSGQTKTTVVPPQPGMSGSDFGKLMDSLTDTDVAGARTAKGTAISAADLRRLGRLHDAGEGRYLVEMGGGFVQSADGKPYVLDLGRKIRAAQYLQP